MKKLLDILKHQTIIIVFLAALIFLAYIAIVGTSALTTDATDILVSQTTQGKILEAEYNALLEEQNARINAPTQPMINPFR